MKKLSTLLLTGIFLISTNLYANEKFGLEVLCKNNASLDFQWKDGKNKATGAESSSIKWEYQNNDADDFDDVKLTCQIKKTKGDCNFGIVYNLTGSEFEAFNVYGEKTIEFTFVNEKIMRKKPAIIFVCVHKLPDSSHS